MIEKNSYDIFYRDNLCAAIVEFCPKNVGHFLIIPLRHAESIFELSDEELLHLRSVALDIMVNHFHKVDFIGRYKRYILRTSESDTKVIDRCNNAIEFINREPKLIPSGFSCGFNEWSNSGKEYDHFHLHVVPAYNNSVNRHGFRFLF
jgi:diadenosine tetraphosphate (Ap4A) HIT family hydrolase